MGVGVVREGFLEEVTFKMSPDGSLGPFILFLGSSLSVALHQSDTEPCLFCFRAISVPTALPWVQASTITHPAVCNHLLGPCTQTLLHISP